MRTTFFIMNIKTDQLKNHMMILSILFLVFVANKSQCQQLFLSMEKQSMFQYESKLNNKNFLFHTSFKPYVLSSLPLECKTDSVYSWMKIYRRPNKIIGALYFHITDYDFIHIEDDDFKLTINPYFDFEIGKDFNWDRTIYINSRGAIIKGDIGSKFSFETYFSENHRCCRNTLQIL